MRRRWRGEILLLAVCLLAGCATSRPPGSYVSGVFESDADLLASAMVEYLGEQLPPASTTFVLQPPARDPLGKALTPALGSALRQAGFAVQEAAPQKAAPGSPAGSGGYALRYLISPLDAGVLVRLQYQQTEASRWYVRNSRGELQAASPFTVRVAP